MAPVMRGEAVLRLHGGADAGRRTLLADRQVQHGSGRLTPDVEFGDMLLEAADAPHRSVEVKKRRVAGHGALDSKGSDHAAAVGRNGFSAG